MCLGSPPPPLYISPARTRHTPHFEIRQAIQRDSTAMEPNNYGYGGASSSNPAADLRAPLRAPVLGDPSSSQVRPLHPAAASSLPLNPPQVLAPPQPPMFQYRPQVLAPPLPPHMFQSLPQGLAALTATPDMRMLPQPHQLWAAGSGYFTPTDAWAVTTTPSRLRADAEAYHPIYLPRPSQVQSPPTLRNGSGSLHPYTPALLRALRADAPVPLTKEEVRARLLRGSTEEHLVMSPVSSAHVVALLAEGDATVRARVINCVRPIVHSIMAHRYPVFLALLNACNGRVDELEDIIGAVCNGKGFAMKLYGEEDHKVKALKELIRVVAWNRPLCRTLLHGLLRKEHMMEEREGPVVLRHCFTMLPYEDCSVIFEDTLGAIDEILSSHAGFECVAVCLENARNGHLKDFEETILTRTRAFAMGGAWSAYFLQHVLRCGSEQLKARIVERVAEDAVMLSVNKYGCYVLEDCILSGLSTGSDRGLQRVLDAFLNLRGDDLAVVVKGPYSNYVIQMLLAAGMDHLPVHAMELARRIEALPGLRNHRSANMVMEVIRKLFPLAADPVNFPFFP